MTDGRPSAAPRAPTYDVNGDVNGPACGCEPGKLDPECFHGVEMEDLAARVARITMGPLPFEEVVAGVRELLEAAGKLPRSGGAMHLGRADHVIELAVDTALGEVRRQGGPDYLLTEARGMGVRYGQSMLRSIVRIDDASAPVAAALAEQLRGFASALDSTEATIARHVAGRLRAIAERVAEPPPLDVVTAMRDPRFKTRGIVIEYREAYPPGGDDEDRAPVLGDVHQLRAVVDDGITYAERRQWSTRNNAWWTWRPHGAGGAAVDDLFLPCRVVPYGKDADAPPSSRGELPIPG